MIVGKIKSVRVTLLKTLQSFNAKFIYFDYNNKKIFLRYFDQDEELTLGEKVKVKVICEECIYTFDSEIMDLNNVNNIFSTTFKENTKAFNRRKYQRVSLKKKAIVVSRGKKCEAETINISEGGIALYTKELLSLVDPIQILIWNSKKRSYFNAKAEIRNVFIEEDRIKYGAEFKELSKGDHSGLIEFLNTKREVRQMQRAYLY